MTPVLAHTPVLKTRRLVLRAPRAADFPFFDAFLATPRAEFIRSAAYDPQQTWRAFGHVIGHWVMRGFGSFIFTTADDDRPLGMTGPWFPAGWPEREIGWSVWSEAAEGQGYAHEAAQAACDHAFRDLGWTTAVSYIDPVNTRSRRLAERLGAVIDPDALPCGDGPCLVYRHPAPERGRTP